MEGRAIVTLTAKMDRDHIVASLVKRDGLTCQYPGEEHDLDLKGTGHDEVTIDHWWPQSYGLSHGWTPEEIWELSNLKLMCKRHNARKGDRLPLEDGTLPPHPRDLLPLHQTRADKSGRVDVCETCESGRLLFAGEFCDICGSGPQPTTFPKYLQRSPKECDHRFYHCWWCTVEEPGLRTRAYEDVFGVE
jgi:5-methylcytosine-specific restriction endonuclease McrA